MADSQTPKRRSNIFVTILAVVGALSLTAVVLFLVTIFWGISSLSQQIHLVSGRTMNQFSKDFIAQIKLEGPIGSENIDSVIEKIDEMASESLAKGIFIEVNSPGGAVVASQELFDKILEVRKSKPVLSYYRDVAASGAYYATAGSTFIVANRGSMVGSIGVLMQNMIIKDLLDWAKLKPVTIKTGALKDAGNPVREPSIEDDAYLSQLLRDTHGQFMDDVMKGRNSSERQKDLILALEQLSVAGAAEFVQVEAALLKEVPPSTMETMRDGRVVLGDEASRTGLTDLVGSKMTALALMRRVLANPSLELEAIEDREDFNSFVERYLQSMQLGIERIIREIALQNASGTPQIQAR